MTPSLRIVDTIFLKMNLQLQDRESPPIFRHASASLNQDSPNRSDSHTKESPQQRLAQLPATDIKASVNFRKTSDSLQNNEATPASRKKLPPALEQDSVNANLKIPLPTANLENVSGHRKLINPLASCENVHSPRAPPPSKRTAACP